MNIKYLLVVIVFIGVLFLGFKYAKPVDKELVNTTPEQSEEIVAENPEGEADPDRMTLDMTNWHWIYAEYNDGAKIVPMHPEKFSLVFRNDGTFSATTDCNSISGKYVVGTDKKITFSEMMSTLMFCAESNETEFRNVLENASSYFFTNRGELIIEQKFDSGTATFR